jgi:hypothetical protein
MNMDEKLAFVRKALEMGAGVYVNFHHIENEDKAKEMGSELESLIKAPFELSENNGIHWYSAENYDEKLEAAVFYNK